MRWNLALRSSTVATKILWGALLPAALGLQACGGGGGTESVPANDVPGSQTEAPAGSGDGDNCGVVPAQVVTPNLVKVTDFGATPNDDIVDTAAIQRELDSLKRGQALQSPAARYLHNKRLNVRVAGVTLKGLNNATLHATNPDDVALMIKADNVAVYSFTLTAVTDVRRNAPWHSRIAVVS